jgi:mono/diheme cytochrome c family protein
MPPRRGRTDGWRGRRQGLWGALAAGLVLACAGCGPAAPDRETLLAEGAALYHAHCATCHMADGSGVPGLQPALIDSPLAAADSAVLIRIMLEGSAMLQRPAYGNEMPRFDQLQDRELAALATYVRATFVGGRDMIAPSDVAVVRTSRR